MTGRKALLDTSVLVDPPAQGIDSFADEESSSAVTVAELHYGIGASTDAVE